ncbi:hypothetical protein HanRHA438_Chr01g0010641 [Helianthus annuus]|uniref:Uncharacterized protein n=1 Tax=Helianthus annuus TaxID=4232 RepID=A0A9K3JU82_HELAN|nr:hypothetical protein HanXRQr2_Chr01g0010251 [Helianthus annuus]KAJ0621676.1 hypothetical protein HanIR_Chr01g0011411 [Helianthus annuus]KAJ0947032.1 hypothetical protein HanRHA438_Chr01g0010641 [Helianthus annuus]
MEKNQRRTQQSTDLHFIQALIQRRSIVASRRFVSLFVHACEGDSVTKMNNNVFLSNVASVVIRVMKMNDRVSVSHSQLSAEGSSVTVEGLLLS